MQNARWIITLAVSLIIASSNAQTLDNWLQQIDIQRIAVAGLQENSIHLTQATQDLNNPYIIQATEGPWLQRIAIQQLAVAGLQANESAMTQAYQNLLTPTTQIAQEAGNWLQRITIQRLAVAGLQENLSELARAHQDLSHNLSLVSESP